MTEISVLQNFSSCSLPFSSVSVITLYIVQYNSLMVISIFHRTTAEIYINTCTSNKDFFSEMNIIK